MTALAVYAGLLRGTLRQAELLDDVTLVLANAGSQGAGSPGGAAADGISPTTRASTPRRAGSGTGEASRSMRV